MRRLALLLALVVSPVVASDRAERLIEDGRLEQARSVLREDLESDEGGHETLYSLARVNAALGDLQRAERMLTASIAAGFTDLHRLEGDPMLEPIRDGETYGAIVDGWRRVLDARAEADFKAVKQAFGERYVYERDPGLRLQFACAHGEGVLDEAMDEVRAVASWAEGLFPPSSDPDRPDPWVTVVLPTPEDFVRLVGAPDVGGYYDPAKRRLISSDLGPSLRHEVVHVLHFRRAERLGQKPAHWASEMVATIVEDLDPLGGGIDPVPSWRTDIAKRRLDGGALRAWDELFTFDRDRFVGHRPNAQYAQSRALGLYLLDRGALQRWLRAYERTHGEDPTGMAAFREAFDRPPAETERGFHEWLDALAWGEPDVEMWGERIGLTLTAGRGDGPEVADAELRGAARDAGLRRRDVIRAVGGRAVRTVDAFYRAVEARAGGSLALEVRRGRRVFEATLSVPGAGAGD